MVTEGRYLLWCLLNEVRCSVLKSHWLNTPILISSNIAADGWVAVLNNLYDRTGCCPLSSSQILPLVFMSQLLFHSFSSAPPPITFFFPPCPLIQPPPLMHSKSAILCLSLSHTHTHTHTHTQTLSLGAICWPVVDLNTAICLPLLCPTGQECGRMSIWYNTAHTHTYTQWGTIRAHTCL